MKAVIIGIFILFGGVIQLFRCIHHTVAYQEISYEFDGSYSPELVYNMDADKEDLPIKKKKTRIRSAKFYMTIVSSFRWKMEPLIELKLPRIEYLCDILLPLQENSLRGPPVA